MATENAENRMNWACQLRSTYAETAPTSIAARPSQNMKTPGTSTSRMSRMPPAMNQSQNPSDAKNSTMGKAQVGELGSDRSAFAVTAGTIDRGTPLAAPPLGTAGGFAGGLKWGPPPKVALAISAMPPSEPSTLVTSTGSI